MKKMILLWVTLFVVVSLACNLPNQGGAPPEITQPVSESNEQQPGAAQPASPAQPDVLVETQVVVVTATPEPTEIPSRPVSVREGLNSLNSYVMNFSTKTTGPTQQDLAEMTMEMRYSADQDAQVTREHNRSASADDPEISESETTIYRIGLEQCTVSGDEFEYETSSPAQKEMTDLIGEMIDMTPIIADPQYVGAEAVNGIETNHFTFQVSGLGAGSGAQVMANQGEYWLAQDGNYIVKYLLTLETQDNEGKVMHLEVQIELTQANQPVEIVMPAGCQP